MYKKIISIRCFAFFSTIILIAIAFHPAINPVWDYLNSSNYDDFDLFSKIASAQDSPLEPIQQPNQTINVFDLINATPPEKRIDTDGDGLYDSVEIVLGTDWNNSDSDFDRLDDYYESTHQLDPMNPDSNYDGLSDYFEVNNVSLDSDNDGIINAWDVDNDNDGVNDITDLSPFSKTDIIERLDFFIQTSGKPTYVNFQIRPKNPSNLRLPQQKWNWPKDDKGFMKDLNNSEDDVYITPMLELTTPVDFKIVAVHSEKCLEVNNASIEENATINQKTFSGADNQKWLIISVGLGCYKIIAKHSEKCLTVKNDSNNTIFIVQCNYTGADSQFWSLEVIESGKYYFVSKQYKKYLSVKNASIEDGVSINLENRTAMSYQQWFIQPIGNTVPPNSETSDYGIITELNTTLIPVTPIKENGAITALQGKMFYPASSPLSLSANVRLLWMVNGKSDKMMKGFKTYNGKYVSNTNENGTINANSSTIGNNETFEWVDLGNKRIAIIANNGKYLSVSSSTLNYILIANSTEIDDSETFELVSLGGDIIALKAYNGKYVRAEGGGGSILYANASVITAWEKFTEIERGFLPEIITLVRYYEEFFLTGFSIQENYGTSIGVFSSIDINQTLKAGFVMGYEFLRSQNTLDQIPGILQQRNVTINSTINTNFSHSDEAVAALMGNMIPQNINELHNQSLDETLPLLSAVEDNFTTINLDNITNQNAVVQTPLIFNITSLPVITLKTFKINWFNTSNLDVLSEETIFNETLDWVLSLGFNETDAPTITMINLVLAWNAGESMITKIGNYETEFNLPELPQVLQILTDYVWTSITAFLDITEAIVKYARSAYNFLKFTMKVIHSLLKALKLTKLLSGMNKVLKAISAAQKAINAAKATKFLSTIDKISAWLLVIDLFITAGIAWYIWFTIAIDQDWSDYGIALAFLVFYTYVIYSLTIIAVSLVFPLLALIFVILDLIFDFFGDFLELVLSWFTDSYYLSSVDMVPIGTPSLNVYDYDENGMDVGDRIGITSRIKAIVERTRGGQQDLDNSYIVPKFNLAIPPGSTWYQNSTVVSVKTDGNKYRNTTYDLEAWVEPQSMINFPMTIQLQSSYRVFYKECVWFFKWWCDRESQSGTSTTTLTTLYYDVMPGNITAFCRWKAITSLDLDGDGINNTNEIQYISNPWRYDTDGDGLWDKFEVDHQMLPYDVDTDDDGLSDYIEIVLGSDPNDKDTDDDGLTDYEEYRGWKIQINYFGTPFCFVVQSDIKLNDTDKDGLSDLEEFMKNLNPKSYDTDANSIDDKNEFIVLTYGFVTDVDFNGLGSSVIVLPNASVNTTVSYRIPAGYNQNQNGTLNCSITILLVNTSINHTITNLTSDPYNITINSTSFQFDAPAFEDNYVLSYFINWSDSGIVPQEENREIIGILSVNETGSGEVKWPCYGPGADSDNDGIINLHESIGWQVKYTTATGNYTILVTSDPKKTDTDGDGLSDVWEHNCFVNSTNPRDIDTDDDGINDPFELLEGTNPLHYDTDGDGLDDSTEIFFESNPLIIDTDFDGLNDFLEFNLKSNPNCVDTDFDGLYDLEEFNFNSSLILPDTDNDTLFDIKEYNLSTNPRDPDTDDDGLLDGYEILFLTDPKDNDTDDDGLNDYLEIMWRTDPLHQDSDNDGLMEGDEFTYGTHPNIPDTDFDGTNDSEDLDTYADHVDHIVLAYDLDQNILEFEENLSAYTTVTSVSADQFLSNPQFFNASYIVLVGRLDSGNETVGNISKNILEQSGENITRILESDFYRFSVSYSVWNHTQTVVILTHPYQSDHWITLNLLKGMRITKYKNSIIAEFPTSRDSFIIDIVKDVDMLFWVYLNKSITPWLNVTTFNISSTPYELNSILGLKSNEKPLNKYINIQASENVQNETLDIINYAWIVFYYTAEDLDRNGDGDCKDTGDIYEKKLQFYFFDESVGLWIKLSDSLDWVFDTGVETQNIEIYGTKYEGYIWANVSHFSFYSLAGLPIKSQIATTLNYPPNADASASEKFGFVRAIVKFDASLSSDDGEIISYNWDFGDGTTGNGQKTTHIYYKAGSYKVVLTITDNLGETDTDSFIVIISQPNNPPSIPIINGNTSGEINIQYLYTAVSTDVDTSDQIKYGWDWDNDNVVDRWTDFYTSGQKSTINHSFSTPGFYRLKAQAMDNNSGLSGWSDILFIFVGIKYEKQNDGTFLIDYEKDDKWDYIYNPETDELTTYLEKTQEQINIIIIFIVIIVIILISLLLIYQNRVKSKQKNSRRKNKKK